MATEGELGAVPRYPPRTNATLVLVDDDGRRIVRRADSAKYEFHERMTTMPLTKEVHCQYLERHAVCLR